MRGRARAREAAEAIIRRLESEGYTAYLAGGCVRDMLLGQEPKDYDVVTDATPDEIIRLFRRTREVGAQFGVVLVKSRGVWVEVATFRTDLSYSDGRRPDRVVFASPREDALRRDFTINGMFYHPGRKEVIDYVGGQEDLRRRLIRAIGDPDERFAEDHLRVLRAVRFAARLGFEIEPRTREAIRRNAHLLARVTPERRREELAMMLEPPTRGRAVRLAQECGLLPYLWEGARFTAQQVEQAVFVMERWRDDVAWTGPLAALCIEQPPQEVDRICRSLTCSNAERERTVWLVDRTQWLLGGPEIEPADVKDLMAGPAFEDLLVLARGVAEFRGRGVEAVERVEREASGIRPEEVRPPPLVSGDDLVAMGYEPGPRFGEVLRQVYREQLNGRLSDREAALRRARALMEAPGDSPDSRRGGSAGRRKSERGNPPY